MSNLIETYFARAAEARDDAAKAVLMNVRERCLRAADAWTEHGVASAAYGKYAGDVARRKALGSGSSIELTPGSKADVRPPDRPALFRVRQ